MDEPVAWLIDRANGTRDVVVLSPLSEILERLKRLAEQRQLLDERTGINMQNTFKEAAETIERMEKVCEIYRCERDRQAAIVESLISRLSHIHGLIQPDHIKLPDGRTMEFAPPPELLMECWRGLSKAIREIPDDLEGLNKTNGDRLERMEKECEQQRDIGGNTSDVLVSRELMAAQITRIERMEEVVETARRYVDAVTSGERGEDAQMHRTDCWHSLYHALANLDKPL